MAQTARLILVEGGSDVVIGDTAFFLAESKEWIALTQANTGVDELAVVAARLFDKSQGRVVNSYQFSFFWADKEGGYDIFQVAEACQLGHTCVQLMSGSFPRIDATAIRTIMNQCQYIGYVHRSSK
jgi:hypothetical protein